jgi:hypothetical protein
MAQSPDCFHRHHNADSPHIFSPFYALMPYYYRLLYNYTPKFSFSVNFSNQYFKLGTCFPASTTCYACLLLYLTHNCMEHNSS